MESNLIKRIIVRPEMGLGDAIYLTAVLRAIKEALPEKSLIANVRPSQKDLLEGLLEENNGFLNAVVGNDSPSKKSDYKVNLSGYLDRNQSITETNYVASLVEMAEIQLRHIFPDIQLKKDSEMKISFHNVKKFRENAGAGKNKVKELKDKYGDKPIIWLGTRTSGSNNRMPQSYKLRENFWDELIESSKGRFIFYEMRSPEQEPISQKIEPKRGESYHFSYQAEIIKASSAGIGLDGMQRAFADALGKKKMIVLLGPTHPRAIVGHGDESNVLTIPSLGEYSKLNYCRGCSMVGYSSSESFKQRENGMRSRYSLDFKLDVDKNCRILKKGERIYDCWQNLDVKTVLKALNSLALS